MTNSERSRSGLSVVCVGLAASLSGCIRPPHRELNPEQVLSKVASDESIESTGAVGHDLTRKAWAIHPELAVALADLEQAQAGIQTAGARPNPSLQLGLTKAMGIPSPWTFAITPTFTMETGGKRRTRIRLAELQVEGARLKVAATAWHLRMGVLRAWVEWEHSRALDRMASEEADLRKGLLAVQRRRFELGQLGRPELDAANLDFLQADNRRFSARMSLQSAELALAQATGVGLGSLKSRMASVPEPAFEPLPEVQTPSSAALIHRLDVRQLLLDWDTNETLLDLELSKRIPNLQWSPGYSWDQGVKKWSLGIGLELPILDRRQGPIAEILAHRKALEADLRLRESKALSEAERAQAREFQARERLRTLAEAQKDQARRLQQSSRSMELGESDRAAYLGARLEALLLQQQAWEAWSEAQNARFDLEEAFQRSFDPLEKPYQIPEIPHANR